MSWTHLKNTILSDHADYEYVMGTRYDGIIPRSVVAGGMVQDNLQQMPALGDLQNVAPNLPSNPLDLGRPDPWLNGGYYAMDEASIARDYAPFQRRVEDLRVGRLASILAAENPNMPMQLPGVSGAPVGVYAPTAHIDNVGNDFSVALNIPMHAQFGTPPLYY